MKIINILRSDAFEIIFPLLVMTGGVAQGSWVCGVGFVCWAFAMAVKHLMDE